MAKMTDADRDLLLAKWTAAYERANGKPWPYQVRYERGFFVTSIDENGYVRETKHRASQIRIFTENLNAYAESRQAIGKRP